MCGILPVSITHTHTRRHIIIIASILLFSLVARRRGRKKKGPSVFLAHSIFFSLYTRLSVCAYVCSRAGCIYSADPSPSVTSGSAANIEIASILWPRPPPSLLLSVPSEQEGGEIKVECIRGKHKKSAGFLLNDESC